MKYQLGAFLLFAFSARGTGSGALPSVNVDATDISVSGLSGGAFMASANPLPPTDGLLRCPFYPLAS